MNNLYHSLDEPLLLMHLLAVRVVYCATACYVYSTACHVYSTACRFVFLACSPGGLHGTELQYSTVGHAAGLSCTLLPPIRDRFQSKMLHPNMNPRHVRGRGLVGLCKGRNFSDTTKNEEDNEKTMFVTTLGTYLCHLE